VEQLVWAVADALDALAAGDEPDDPFEGISDDALRLAAIARSIPIDHTADRDELVYALLDDRLAEDDVERGHPYPGQRYTHGWIPVAGLAQWNRDLDDKQDLVDAVTSGARRAGPYRFSSRNTTQADLVDFGNGTEGVVTTYGAERDADGDQLGAALARSIGVPAPRKLRVADNRTVSDLVDGPTWTEREDQIRNDARAYELPSELESKAFDSYNYPAPVKATEKLQNDDIDKQREEMLSSPAGLRLGLLDLLLGVDERDGGTIVLGPHGVVPVQSETAWSYADGRFRLHEAATGRAHKANGAVPPVQRRLGPDDLVTWSAFSEIRSWKDNPLTAADVAFLRQRLDEARAQFLRLNRRRWWEFASDRLDALAKHATGTVDLFGTQS